MMAIAVSYRLSFRGARRGQEGTRFTRASFPREGRPGDRLGAVLEGSDARAASGGRNLTDAAPDGAGLDRAPEDLVAVRKRPAVRHGEPEPVEEPDTSAAGVVLERGPRVIDHVVVQELHVAGL